MMITGYFLKQILEKVETDFGERKITFIIKLTNKRFDRKPSVFFGLNMKKKALFYVHQSQ